jgi:zinc transport system ATP-binding protein
MARSDDGTLMLEVSDLGIRFGDTCVLEHVSFSVARGAAVAVIGPNGAGKTQLFRALIGAIPFEGRVRWAGGARIGYVPQKLDLARDVPMTGEDFLWARASLARTSKADVAGLLAAVGLAPGLARQPIGALSGGQFQRLLVAFALVGRPNVLLLDEPTAGVDVPGEEQLNELVHRLQEEQHLTVLLISHDLSVVYRYASDVLCLGHGHGSFGPPRTILSPELLRQTYGHPVAYHVHDESHDD